MIEADYIIIGAGAVGLAFADTILSESPCSVAIIDRNHKPGGHWHDAYDFVTLHQPSAFYGINSLPLGDGRLETEGPNQGLYELAPRDQLLTYFEDAMNMVFLPSGRCTYLPRHEYLGDAQIRCLDTDQILPVRARRKWVDAAYFGTTVPSRHTPGFSVADNQTLIPPNDLSRILGSDQHGWEKICILGAGKTAMDAAYWLLAQGYAPEHLCWVVPRDSWLLNRLYTQPGEDFFEGTIGKQAEQIEIFAQANSVEDVFLRLEQAGIMLRIDPEVMPSMYHCATMSEKETRTLGKIRHVLRRGRVSAISPTGLVFESGKTVTFDEKTLFVDCTASAVERRPVKPVFEQDQITLQMIRTCQPTFSAALIAFIELTIEDADRRNQLCTVPPLPEDLAAFLPISLTNMMNQYIWSQDKAVRAFIRQSRLDGFSKMIDATDPSDTVRKAILMKFREHSPAAIANLQRLMA